MEIFKEIAENLRNTSVPAAILEFILLVVVFYYTMLILKNNNAKVLIWTYAILLAATGIVFLFLNVDKYAYLLVPLSFSLGIIVLFSTEIKRAVWNFRSGKLQDAKHIDTSLSANTVKECINEIVRALQNMSKNDIGALIILSNNNLPNSILESGVNMDSEISTALIESVFFPKTPLHDGAMVIKGTKIQAAGCFLPLSQEVNLPKDLGTRHRAGIGITETIDVTAIIVSEETGVISIANGGRIKRYADSEMLRATLQKFYSSDGV